MNETAVGEADESPLEPVREMVRKMIQGKRDEIESMQRLTAELSTRIANLTLEKQTGMMELHQLELALKRLDGD